MADFETLESNTAIYINNVPDSVDEKFLECYFREALNLPICQMHLKLFRIVGSNAARGFVDLGSQEKVQEVIRNLNGSEIKGQKIFVTVAMRPFAPSPGQRVYLKKLPDGINNEDIYDLLSMFGPLLGLELKFSYKNGQQLHSACGILYTEEQAQRAIHAINASRLNEDSIIAEADRRWSSIRHDIWVDYENELEVHATRSDAGNSENTAPLSSPSWNQHDSPGVDQDEDKYTDEARVIHAPEGPEMCDDANETYFEDDLSLPDPEVPQLDLSIIECEYERKLAVAKLVRNAYKDEFESSAMLKNIINVLTNSLTPHHMLEHCTKRSRFRLYCDMAVAALNNGMRRITQLSPKALEAAYELNLVEISCPEKKKLAIRDRLFCMGFGYNSTQELETILDILLSSSSLSELLEICSSAKLFTIYATVVTLAIHSGALFYYRFVSAEAVELVHQLRLYNLSTVAQRRQMLRDYLVQKHEKLYGRERIEKLSDYLFEILRTPRAFYTLLDICTADTIKFGTYATVTEITMETSNQNYYDFFSNGALHLEQSFDLSKLETFEDWGRSLQNHAVRLHQKSLVGKYSNSKLLVANLPEDVENDFLRSCFESALECSIQAETLLLYTTESGRKTALLDVGSFELAQKAIRLVNGSIMNNSRILVTMATNASLVTSDNCLVLRNIPRGFFPVHLFDLFSTFGPLLGIRHPFEVANDSFADYALVYFISAQDAHEAMRCINAVPQSDMRVQTYVPDVYV